MDKRIIWFAVIIVLIGGGLFAVRLFWGRAPSDLKQLDFTVSPQTIFVEDSVEFRDNTSGARQWNWDFGDPGGVPDIRKKGWYRFVTAGRYTLRLTVNGKTTDSSITVVVNPRNGPAIGARVQISGPSEAYVGEPATYKDVTPGAQHTNWQNMDRGDVKMDSHTYTTVFTHKGDFEIIAENELNKGADGQGIKKVHVMEHPVRMATVQPPPPTTPPTDKPVQPAQPQPTQPQPAAQQTVRLASDPELTTHFKDLASRQDGFRAQYAVIRKAAGENESIPVTIVKKSDGSVLSQKDGLFGACQMLNMMQLSVSSVSTQRDPNDQSIKAMTITVNQ